ncbi:GNAT family N-acetyltransferase [Streptomyces flavofungini]|uniref:GNAT family N-acetyltransferase n=1 Tax=Streptomyces flavofungini TaxID=68200 RepID=A0ABS0X3X2_9ACTN|nr:GNAT family N-acetyltransferase [Streptomyces flavofungini]MBJ3807887.1 GNAT family N-acetyltransferase [Streptomyces flavofungini]GHC78652.1 acetyltransferase [Streptomyces flavofungini]
MPYKIPNVVEHGTFAGQEQPTLPADGGLRLRPWALTDAPAVYEAFQDPALQRWHARVADSEDEAREWIGGWIADWTEERTATWAVVDTATDEVAGRVALREVTFADGQAELAYWTLPRARGRGVAPRAVTALSAWALDVVGLHRLELTHATANEASCRVALKTGFAVEGTMRSAVLHEDGWHDMHLHARIRGDGQAAAG